MRFWKSSGSASSSSPGSRTGHGSSFKKQHGLGSGDNVLQIRNLDEEYGTSSSLALETIITDTKAETGGRSFSAPNADGSTSHGADETSSISPSADSRRPDLSMGWLLRLFRSEFFDAYMAVTYLYKYRNNPGVQDYLCNELYSLKDADLEDYLPQLCSLLLYHVQNPAALESFLFDRCSKSIHIALQVYWFLQSATDDAIAAKDEVNESGRRKLRTICETCAVNGDDRSIYESILAENEASQNSRSGSLCGITKEKESKTDDRPVEKAQQAMDQGINGVEDFHVNGKPESDVGFDDGLSEQLQDLDLREDAAEINTQEETTNHTDIMDKSEAELLLGRDPATGSVSDISALTPAKHNPSPFDPAMLLAIKQERFDYFNDTLTLIKTLVKISLNLRDLPLESRDSACRLGLAKLNDFILKRMAGWTATPLSLDSEKPLPNIEEITALGEIAAKRSIHLPLSRAGDHSLRVLRFDVGETIILSTRARAPYMVFLEVYESRMNCSDRHVFCEHLFANHSTHNDSEDEMAAATAPFLNSLLPDPLTQSGPTGGALESRFAKDTGSVDMLKVSSRVKGQLSSDKDDSIDDKRSGLLSPTAKMQHFNRALSDPVMRVREHVRKQIYGKNVKNSLAGVDNLPEDEDADAIEAKKVAMLLVVYGELWEFRQKRILQASPFGKIPKTKLAAFIVKAGDDLRQEQLAIQLIRQFDWIFKTESVDLFLRPFSIICVNADAGLVELVPNAVSLHGLKKKAPHFISLRNHFERTYGPPTSKSFQIALKNFVSSMAAYSLVSYFLQIKDRHNGNLMLDAEGHIVHIDFGFMLSNSPGAIKFETAPFKLTDELMEVMGGEKSEAYLYFKELVVLGFLASKKHSEKIITLVEILLESNSVMPCMQGGPLVLEQLRARFLPALPESECIRNVLALIDESCNNWRSKQYDRFQWYTNGIL
eukprot:CAMPEP_0184706356 /NCGR_PEP_ID=MMETSP0313-20130426/36715_1 /TAXON_ID=2792 /ORGANISM="Porphyridium aerugineum, Strain SAG 1380-2" /LENGTH=942 /DNA_ID=CAMNT_0027167909 /DNA_START=346 /DNA_END=3174 /DNA_ORIENTATION=-